MPPKLSREQRREQKTKLALQYSHDYFDYFYRDAPYPGVPARRGVFTAFPIPRWTSSRRPDPALDPLRVLQVRDRKGQEFWRATRMDTGGGRSIDPGIRQKLEALAIEIGSILGAGSQGLAFAVRYDGEKMVVKYATDIQPMVVEMWAMREMAGARHVVQVSKEVQAELEQALGPFSSSSSSSSRSQCCHMVAFRSIARASTRIADISWATLS